MTLIKRLRKKHRAVYWKPDPDEPYDVHGGTNFLPPIQINCYWMDNVEREMTGGGEEVVVRSTVYPDRELVSGGVVWQGLLVDAPDTPPEHYKIKIRKRITPPRGKDIYIVKL